MIDKTIEDFLPSKQATHTIRNHNFKLGSKLTKDVIINCIKKVMDPEIPVNLYDLGLIYEIKIINNDVRIKMTLTNPNCPVAGEMPKNVAKSLENLESIRAIDVELVWEPKWDKNLMSEDAKLALDIF